MLGELKGQTGRCGSLEIGDSRKPLLGKRRCYQSFKWDRQGLSAKTLYCGVNDTGTGSYGI